MKRSLDPEQILMKMRIGAGTMSMKSKKKHQPFIFVFGLSELILPLYLQIYFLSHPREDTDSSCPSFFKASALSVLSQVKSGSFLPKCPYAAVFR